MKTELEEIAELINERDLPEAEKIRFLTFIDANYPMFRVLPSEVLVGIYQDAYPGGPVDSPDQVPGIGDVTFSEIQNAISQPGDKAERSNMDKWLKEHPEERRHDMHLCAFVRYCREFPTPHVST